MYFLGIDIGTGGTRALVIDQSGAVISSAAEEHRPFSSLQIGWAEQDPTDWWRACGLASRKALTQGSIRAEQIACIGLSGQMHGAVLLDEQGQVRAARADLVRRANSEAGGRVDIDNRR